jgi:hypothetical protein
MVRKYKLIGGSILIFILVFSIFLFYFNDFENQKESFSTNAILFKLSIVDDGNFFNEISIKNEEDFIQDFSISFSGLDGLVSSDFSKFSISPGNSKMFNLTFKNDGRGVGVYVGKLIISSSSLEKEIPIILSIGGKESVFAIIYNSIGKSTVLNSGDSLKMDIKLFEISKVLVPVIDSKYFIKNFDGEIILSGETNLIVGGIKREIIPLSDDLPLGDYVFISVVDYKGTKSLGSYIFNVSKSNNNFFTENFFIIILSSLIFVVILFFGSKNIDKEIKYFRRQGFKFN